MKNILFSIVSILFFASTMYANNKINNEPKKDKDMKLYKKHVYSPLKEASSKITYGKLTFQMSIFKNKEEKPLTYNCTLEFSRWPVIGSALPSMTLSIGDTLLYVTDKDSLFVFDLITNTHTTGDFKTAMDFIYENQFISFYAYYYSLAGKAKNVSVVKEGQFVSCKFDFSPTLENIQKGYYNFVYDPKTNLLRKYTFETTGISKEKSDFERIECELIHFQNSELEAFIRMQIIGYLNNWITKVDMINNCNVMIGEFNRKHNVNYPNM